VSQGWRERVRLEGASQAGGSESGNRLEGASQAGGSESGNRLEGASQGIG
jgi:hypothetical protein